MENNTTRWIDKLQDFSTALNNVKNRATGMKPDSINSENWHAIYDKLYKDTGENYKTICKFSVGDQVRIPIEVPNAKRTFRKGTLAKWSAELYTIIKAYRTGSICYFKIRRESNAKKHIFYEKELNLVIRKR